MAAGCAEDERSHADDRIIVVCSIGRLHVDRSGVGRPYRVNVFDTALLGTTTRPVVAEAAIAQTLASTTHYADSLRSGNIFVSLIVGSQRRKKHEWRHSDWREACQ